VTIAWTPDMVAMLRALRLRGVALELCGERIGVCLKTARAMARRLGIARRMNRGAMPGEAKVRADTLGKD
jgi:hypothetical protein